MRQKLLVGMQHTVVCREKPEREREMEKHVIGILTSLNAVLSSKEYNISTVSNSNSKWY